MTTYSAEIKDIVTKELDGVAEVTVTDQGTSTIVHLHSLASNQTVDHTILHGSGYGSTARGWAQALRKTLHLPVVTTEITVGFEGSTKDVNDLAFGLFEAGMLREGLRSEERRVGKEWRS